MSRVAGDVDLELRALNGLAALNARLQRYDEAERQLQEALAIARRLGDRGREAYLLHTLGVNAHIRASAGATGQLKRATELYRQSYDLLEDLGMRAGALAVLGDLAQARVERGLLVDGARDAHELLRGARELQSVSDISFSVIVHGQIALVSGDRTTGLGLIGAVIADPRAEHRDEEIERILRVHGIDMAEAAPELETGRSLDLDAIVQLLLEQGAGGRLATEPIRLDVLLERPTGP
jgi:hypothetical protein